ncbi:MAG TPA: rhamnulokinase family protein [Fibrobacteria bacterium]|nr:rhamnulokinase family protein [Fibrobacteria bacterium]
MEKHYLAIDLGAESGRVMLGSLAGGRLAVEEIHRFPNVPVHIRGTLRWNLLDLFSEAKEGLRKAAARGVPISSLSTDAWGVDYVLFKEKESMVTNAYHYRDSRTDGAMEKVFAKVPADAIFAETGIQFMPINTLYQLFMDLEQRPEVLAWADRFLNIGDYFNYLLTGIPYGEASLASTSQLYNPAKTDWAWDLIARLGLPKKLFPALVKPGTKVGPLLSEVALETNLKGAQVVASCSHDTAAAVAAVPAEPGQGDWAFLSSGTWSLLGTELGAPLIDATGRKYNFTNEAGYGGTIMFRKNIVGLWIVQECRRAWAEMGNEYNYDELTAMAEAAVPLRSLIRPEDARFGKPGRMPGKIVDYCRETGQPVPTDPGSMIRCALESLALLYAKTLGECAAATGRKFRTLHVVGGGSRNRLLNQFTADALQLPVQAGPVEATTIGNLLIQAKTLGHETGDLRAVVRRSFHVETFGPADAGSWHGAAKRFEALPVS